MSRKRDIIENEEINSCKNCGANIANNKGVCHICGNRIDSSK